jgi:hypothetical protein
VLDNANGSSSLADSLSTVANLLEGWVDAAAANKVHWGTRLALLGSRHNTILMKDRVDALCILARLASDSLASNILHSVTRAPPDGAEE